MTMDPGGQNSSAVVQITLGQVYNVVTETQKELRDLTHSVQAAVGQLGDHEQRIRTMEHDGATSQEVEDLKRDHGIRLAALEAAVAPIADHKSRLPAVEKKVWMASGVAALAAGGSGVLAWLAAIR